MEIRKVRSIEEYKIVEDLQKEIWGMEGEYPVPVTILVAINNNGGLVEIALDGGNAVGFSLAFPGKKGDYEYLYSHMAGVIEEYRNSNVGYEIKMHQFKVAEELGYNEVRWTFDPLKVRNSYFNTHKLKAFAYDYKINYYGHMDSRENKGVESDRIEAHKFFDRTPVNNSQFTILGKIKEGKMPFDEFLEPVDDFVALEVLEEIPRSDIDLLRKWREKTREAFLKLEKKDYVMVDVKRESPYAYLIFAKREKSGL